MGPFSQSLMLNGLRSLVDIPRQATESSPMLVGALPEEPAQSWALNPASVIAGLANYIEALNIKGAASSTGLHRQRLQEAFVRYLATYGGQLQDAGISSHTNRLNTVLNGFLAQQGFSQQLKPFEGMGLVMSCDLSLTWYKQGTPSTIRRQGVDYPAVTLNDPAHIEVFEIAGEPGRHVVEIRTPSGHAVCFCQPSRGASAPAGPMELMAEVDAVLATDWFEATMNPGGITLPVIACDTEAVPNWSSSPVAPALGHELPFPTQVYQSSTYRLGESGFSTKTATGIVMSLHDMARKPMHRPEEPFSAGLLYYWVTAGDLQSPLAVGFFDPRKDGVLVS